MAGSDGYKSWTKRMLRELYLDGVALLDSQANIPADWKPETPGTILRTMDGGGILQYPYTGGDTPLLSRALSIGISMQHNIEADYERMCEAETYGPRRWWMELWLPCVWLIYGKNAGQTLWKTDRRLPYGGAVPGVTHATHPPKVTIDGTAQTIITSGTPAAGQALVPESAGFASITMPAAITGTLLTLWCPFELQVRIAGPSSANPEHNRLNYSATLEEIQGDRSYTGATE